MGREIDAQVAEKVMGFMNPITVYRWRDRKARQYPMLAFTNAAKVSGWEPLGEYSSHVNEAGEQIYCGKPHSLHFPQHYSTDISAAFQVFLKLAEIGIVRLSNGDGDSKDCDFLPFNGLKHSPAHFSCDTYEVAICLAALQAISERGEK